MSQRLKHRTKSYAKWPRMAVEEDFSSEGLNRQCYKHWEKILPRNQELEAPGKVFCLQNVLFCASLILMSRFFSDQLKYRKDVMSHQHVVGLYARPIIANQEPELFLIVVSVSPCPAKTGKGNIVTVTAPAGNIVIATGQ